MGFKSFYIQFICYLSFVMGFAQIEHSRVENLTTSDGMSSNTVYSIVQDHEGFMWFGADVGLNKYNGYEFQIWQDNLEDTSKGSLQNTGNLMVDSKGSLWIGLWGGGLINLNLTSGDYQLFLNDLEDAESLSENRVQTLFEDSKGNYWFGTYQSGLNKLDPKTGKFKRYQFQETQNSISENRIWALSEDTLGNIWIGTDGGLDILNVSNDSITTINDSGEEQLQISSHHIREIIQDKNNMWVGTTEGIDLIDTQNSVVTTFNCENTKGLPCGIINSMKIDHMGYLWVGTYSGLSRFKIKNNNTLEYLPLSLELKEVAGAIIREIYEDKSNVLWVSTDNKGIFKIDNSIKKFNNVYLTENEIKTPLVENVTAIAKDDKGYLWIGTNRVGLIRIDMSSGEYVTYTESNESKGVSNNYVLALEIDSKGELWVGTFSGLDRYNYTTDSFETISREYLDQITTIKEDIDGNLWVGTLLNGLFQLDTTRQDITQYKYDATSHDGLSHPEVWSVFQDKQKHIWVGTGNGVNKLNLNSKSFVRYQNDITVSNSLNGFRVLDIEQDREGNMWFATDEGLNKLKLDNGKFTFYSSKDGLTGSYVGTVSIDDNDNIWMSTNMGISKLNPSNNKIWNYNIDDGLQGNEFNSGAKFKDANGDIYFGGIKGLNTFNPLNIIDDTSWPLVKITKLEVFGSEHQISYNLSELDQIDLSYTDKVINIEFAALEYAGPEFIQYAYKLDGYHDDWIVGDYQHQHRSASFTSLEYGEYTFRVRSTNRDGLWNNSDTAVVLRIAPPWWATTSAKFVFVLSFIAIITLVFKTRLDQVRNKEEQKHRLMQLESLAMRAQMNPNFISNVLSGIQGVMLIEGEKEANKYFGHFSNVLRRILQMNDAAHITLKDEVDYLKSYLELEKLRLNGDLNFEINVNKELNWATYVIPNLYLQPIIEKAIWLGLWPKDGDKTLKIDFNIDEPLLYVTIEDNGIGRDAASHRNKRPNYRSWGSIIMDERIRLSNKLKHERIGVKKTNVKEKDGIITGTKVVVEMPIKMMNPEIEKEFTNEIF